MKKKKKPIERIVWLESIEASMIVVAQLKWVFFFVKTLNRIGCRYEYKNLVTPDQSKQKTKFICSFSGKRRLNLLFVYCLHTVNRVCSNIRKLLFLFWIVVHSHHKLMHFQCCYRKKETHILSTY